MTIASPSLKKLNSLASAGWFHVFLILVVLLAARHLLHGSFGFYEDDYTLVVRSMAAEWSEVWDFISEVLGGFGGQGRPLQHSMVFLLAYLSGRLGGLSAAYWLAYLIIGMNAVLFYVLLRRLVDGSFALLGGLAYALFFADTTQTFLYHAFGLQQALTFLILATLAYISERRILAYLLSLGSLLSYESAYLVFLGAPLLEEHWDKQWRKRFIVHAIVMLAMLAGVVALRLAVGEERVQSLGVQSLIQDSLLHTLQGPWVGFGSYLLRPIQAISNINIEVFLASVLAFLVFAWVLGRQNYDAFVSPGRRSRLLRLLIAGGVMLALAYPLTFTVRAYAISGRDTRVHLAGAIGAALILASGWMLAMARVKRAALRRVLVIALAGVLALSVGFGVLVQQDYARSWDLQKRLWSSLVETTRDLEDGTVVFVDPAGLIDTRYIGANTWNLPLVLQYIIEFPEEWQNPPRVHRLLPDWRERTLTNRMELKAVDFKWEYVVVPWQKAIVLETRDGRVLQRLAELELGDDQHDLKPEDAGQQYPQGYLHGQLIGRAE